MADSQSFVDFAVELYRYIGREKMDDVGKMYERSTDMFKNKSWECLSAVAAAEHVGPDSVIFLLFKELWYRHLSSPTLQQRIDSWDNYCYLFEVMSFCRLVLQLPNQWLWDLVDGFVNQFQSFSEYLASEDKTKDEKYLLREYDEAWSVFDVLKILRVLMERSSIIQILAKEQDVPQLFPAADHTGQTNLLKVMGYFSMVGLLRVYCLLGDYQAGLNYLAPIHISQEGFYTCVIGSYLTTIYHYGFANLMLGRHGEAVFAFNKTLADILKNNRYQQIPQQYEQVYVKVIEHMYALLAVCLVLCSQFDIIDDNVKSRLMEKYSQKMSGMQKEDHESFAVYHEILSNAWPTFITPFSPNLVNLHQAYPQYIIQESPAPFHYDDDDVELMRIVLGSSLTPYDPNYVEPRVEHKELEVVIADILKSKLK